MRLDKYLADMNAGTRSTLRREIRKGLVTVDGKAVKDPACPVGDGQEVRLNGRKIVWRAYEYYLLNKPQGVISATEDPRQETVLHLLPEIRRADLFPVGRLDKDTTGLLLITNDGELAHRLLSPKKHVDKRYRALIDGEVTEEMTAAFRAGLMLDGEFTALPAELTAGTVHPDGTAEAEVVICEGRFHQVKRMFAAVGRNVLALTRLAMGPLSLPPELPEGAFRELTQEELAALRTLRGTEEQEEPADPA